METVKNEKEGASSIQFQKVGPRAQVYERKKVPGARRSEKEGEARGARGRMGRQKGTLESNKRTRGEKKRKNSLRRQGEGGADLFEEGVFEA